MKKIKNIVLQSSLVFAMLGLKFDILPFEKVVRNNESFTENSLHLKHGLREGMINLYQQKPVLSTFTLTTVASNPNFFSSHLQKYFLIL